MTVAMYGETATGAAGENRDLVGASTSFPPKLENPTERSGAEPEKNEWEPDASDALDRGEATDANASARDAANEQPGDRGASAGRAEGGRAQEGGESPNSALTTCRPGEGSADPATRDASEENEGRIHVHDEPGSRARSESAPGAGPAPSAGTREEEKNAGAATENEDARRVRDETDEDARTRAACASCFSSTDDEGRMRELRAMGQKELQETFRVAFRRATTSNNNQWLRRRIAGALGLEAAPAASARAAGGSARGTPGASPGSGLTTPGSAGGTTTEDGVRKSNRAAKPKILDFLPSAVCAQVANELPGEAAIDRRVRVFWPAEGAFFPGTVQAFNSKNGKHAVRYDDGDVEEVLLAAERIEWVYPGEDANVPRAPATAAGGGALSAKTKAVVVTARRINFAVPQPGKPAEVLAELGNAWPSPGQHVWGRVKGHGWWPGVAIGASAAEALGVAPNKEDAAMRSVRFFDNTAAAVHRHDLVPFREYEKTLGRAKKSVSFQAALKAAKQSFEKAAKRGEETALPARLTKQQQAAAAKAAAAAEDAPPSASGFAPPFEDPAKTSKRKSADVNDGGGVAIGSFPRFSKMMFDPAGVPLRAEPGGAKKARFGGDVSAGALGDLERRVGFTRDGDGDFVRAAEAKIAAEAMMATAPSRGDGFQKPQAPKRSHKKGQGLKARAAAEAAGLPWPPPRPPGVGRGRGRGAGASHRHDGSGKQRADATGPRAHVAHMSLSTNPGDQLGLLSRKLDALQTRVAPLAIAASQHLRKQLQLSQLATARGANPQMHPSAMMTENERATLLEEMEVLQRLLRWSDGGDASRGREHGYPPMPPPRGGGARFFDGGSYAGEGAGMPAPGGEPDPGMARMDPRWAGGGLDPIDMAMLHGGGGDMMDGAAADGDMNELWGAPDGTGDGDDDELVADDFLRSAGPSIEVDTLMAEVHAARRATPTVAPAAAKAAPDSTGEEKPSETPAAAGARARTASPAPSDTTQ